MQKLLVAALIALAGSLGVSAAADAAYTLQGQRLETQFSAPPLDKKVPGPVDSLVIDIITDYTGTPGPVAQRATRTRTYFAKDGRINTAGLPQCDPATPGFATATSESAIDLCGPALVGQGTATLVGPVSGITAKVLLFNGTQPNGLPTLLLHGRTTANTTTVQIGTIRPSDLPGYGLVLDVPIPPLPLGLAITDFVTTVNKIRLPSTGRSAAAAAKGKKKPKRKAPPQYYLMATCSTGSVTFQALTDFDGGGASTTSTSTNTCAQKKAKKKKKGKPKK